MAVNVGTLEAILRLKDEMSPALKAANQNVSLFSGALGKLTSMVGGVLSVGAAISAVNKALMAQAEAEAAINKLNQALANQGIYTEALSKSLIAHASALQDVTTFDDEAILRGEALLVSFKMTEEQIKKTTLAAANMAAAMGIDLETAINLLGRAFAGNTQMLSRYGIVVDENIPKSQKFEAVMQQLEQRFGGQAQAATATYTGSMKQLGNAFNDTQEAAGKMFGFLTSSGDKPFQGLINVSKWLTTFFAVQVPLAFSELKANIAQWEGDVMGTLENIFDVLGKLPGMAGQSFRREAENIGMLRASLHDAAEKFREQGNAAAASVGHIQKVTNVTQTAATATHNLTEEEKKAIKAAQDHARELLKLNYALDGQAFQLEVAREHLEMWLATTVQGADKLPDLTQDILDLNAALGQGPEMDPDVIGSLIEEGAKAAEDAWKRITWGGTIVDSMTESFKRLPNVIVGALQGGGDVLKAVGAEIGGTIGKAIGEKLAKEIGGRLGEILGSAVGPIGAAVGSWLGDAISSLGSALGIGGNKEIMQINDLRDAFIEAHGGWKELQKDLAKATDQDLLKKLFDAKTVEQYNAAMQEITDTLGLWETATQSVEEAAERYGLTIEELGPAFQQQKLDEMVGQLLKDWELLIASGADMNAVLKKMAPAFNDYVQKALAAGKSIPENMRPIIDKMIEEGLLLDANGNAYKSAEEAGITYTKSLSEGLAEVIEQIKALVAALTGVKVPPIVVPVVYEDPGWSPGEPRETPGYASGSTWQSFGRGTLAMLHGVERVQTPAQAAAELETAKSGNTALLSELRALRRDMSDMPVMLKRSFRDAMMLK